MWGRPPSSLSSSSRTEFIGSHAPCLRPHTAENYRLQIAAYVVPHIGRVRLDQLAGHHLDRLYGRLAAEGGRAGKPLAPKTVRNVHTMLHRALADALRWGLITYSPADRVTAPTSGNGRSLTGVWTAEQAHTFLEHVRQDEYWALWILAASTGMRRSELLGLTWTATDLPESRLSVTQSLHRVKGVTTLEAPKTRRSARQIALDPETVRALTTHRSEQARQELSAADYQDADFVFAKPDGTPLNPAWVTRRFSKLADSAGLPHIRLHDLRHTWATLALQQGI